MLIFKYNCPVCNYPDLKRIRPSKDNKYEYITFCPKCHYTNHYVKSESVEYIGNKQIFLVRDNRQKYLKKWYDMVIIAGRNFRKHKKKTRLPDDIKEIIDKHLSE